MDPKTLELLTEALAADALGVSPRTLQRWRVNGEGPAFRKLGRKHVAYTPADLHEFVQRARRTSTSDTGGGEAA